MSRQGRAAEVVYLGCESVLSNPLRPPKNKKYTKLVKVSYVQFKGHEIFPPPPFSIISMTYNQRAYNYMGIYDG